MSYMLLEEGVTGVAPPLFSELCETNISMFSQAMSWLSLSDFWRSEVRKDRKSRQWEKYEKNEGRANGKAAKMVAGKSSSTLETEVGSSAMSITAAGFCVYQGVGESLQTRIILHIEDQQKNRTRKSKSVIWGLSFLCCDLGLNPTIIAVGFGFDIIMKGGSPNSGYFNDLLSRAKRDLRRNRTYITAKKPRSSYWSQFKS